MVIVLMGVSGSGKTTVGQKLAAALGWEFADADQFHPAANIAKMTAGHALNDADRAPWLAAIHAHIERALATGPGAVVTCSALKQAYRHVVVVDPARVKLVYLKGSRELLQARLKARRGHFMKPAMLDGQLATLEEPSADEALTVDIDRSPERIVAAIRAGLSL